MQKTWKLLRTTVQYANIRFRSFYFCTSPLIGSFLLENARVFPIEFVSAKTTSLKTKIISLITSCIERDCQLHESL